MNFFGHAVVAHWRSGDSRFVFAAMLPDFASMCRGRIAAISQPVAREGFAWHHQTDAAFHQLPSIVSLLHAAESALRERDVSKGPARGAAHVAVELLLDGWLLDDKEAGRRYLAALRQAEQLEAYIAWEAPDQRARWLALKEWLLQRGLPTGYRESDRVAAIVAGVLGRRPLLAPREREVCALRAYLPALRHAVGHRAGAIMKELRAELVAG